MTLKTTISQLQVLAEGGEGIIYEYGNKLIKAYKSHVDLVSKEKKIKALMQKNLPREAVIPVDIVYDNRGKFTGYLMEKVDGTEFKRLSNSKFVRSNNITTKEILTMLYKIQEVLEILHKEGIYVGDLNDQNILFDKQYNVYFIDCDSWTVGSEKCTVAMDLFKDPLLKSNDFNEKTDTYAFAVLIWKALTRIHPFGGTMSPDMNIMDRMAKGISVIDNPSVTIPKKIRSWKNLSIDLIEKMKAIFSNKERSIGNEIKEMLKNLSYCKKHQDYYYSKYTSCPLCDVTATVQKKPVSQGVMSGLKLYALLDGSIIQTMLNETTYLDVNGCIVNASGKKISYKYGTKYYFMGDYWVEALTESFVVHSEQDYTFEKKFKSPIIVEGNHVYYLSRQNSFRDIMVMNTGNGIKTICKCSNNSYYEVSNGHYCIVNYYEGKLIVNTDGRNVEIPYDFGVVEYGVHYDTIGNKWLIILEDSTGTFHTFVVSQDVEYKTDEIKYECQLSGVCISNSTIFIPIDGKIRGFSYKKSAFKDFDCSIVSGDSKLIKKKNKFTIVNDENVYSLG